MKAVFLFASAAFAEVAFSAFASGDDEVRGAKCAVYLAKSTIENAGLGVFTAVPLGEGDRVGFGDMSIPIFDIDFHAGGSKVKEDYHWLMDEYTWKASESSPHMELEAEMTSAWVPGMGSMPNCHFRLKNIGETRNEHDAVGISRTDPGVGAFTPYHNRFTYTLAKVEAGQELFVDYGMQWFLSRENYMGLVPLVESYPKASKFVDSLQYLLEKTSTILRGNFQSLSSLEEAMSDLMDLIKQSPYKSRPLVAVPESWAAAKRAFEVGVEQTELEQSIRSLDYLEKHGKCLDNIRPGTSRIPHAGRGAFATRFMQKGSYVGIAQLAHIPDRDVLAMYADKIDPETGEELGRDLSKPTGKQILINYCWGHRSSSLLLCPYSSGTSFINHNRKSPNAKIIWSDAFYQTTSWLDEPVSFFDNIWHGGLAFEYIAISDIKPGDEITVDYGHEWEVAWSDHVRKWRPPEGAESYISPQELNESRSIPIPTYDEDKTLVGENIAASCHFSHKSIKEGKHAWQERDMTGDEHNVRRIIGRTQLPSDESYIYSLEIDVEARDKGSGVYFVTDVPRKALSFHHNNYKSDLFVKGVFRHEMMIPHEMFPDAWKNVV